MSLFGKSLDFVAIGDITNRCIIRLKDARITCDVNDEIALYQCALEQIPYESVQIIRAGW